MYQVQRAGPHAGRETITVTSNGKRVASASVDFVRWLKSRVPRTQLRPEQVALVEWFDRHQAV
jgi:hypothetical protein